MNRQLRGSLFLLAAAMVWGMAFAAQSSAMDQVEPFTFNAARSLITALALINAPGVTCSVTFIIAR